MRVFAFKDLAKLVCCMNSTIKTMFIRDELVGGSLPTSEEKRVNGECNSNRLDKQLITQNDGFNHSMTQGSSLSVERLLGEDLQADLEPADEARIKLLMDILNASPIAKVFFLYNDKGVTLH